MSFDDLRVKYPQLVYDRFETNQNQNKLVVTYFYNLPPHLSFTTQITIPTTDKTDIYNINNLLFHLGIIELLSYWKLTCSPQIVINAGYLNSAQINFWSKLFFNGMGEYFYRNQIDITNPKLFTITPGSNTFSSPASPTSNKSLIMTAGGKDTAVTLGLFQLHGQPHSNLLIAPTQVARQVSQLSSPEHSYIIDRNLDPQILSLNQQGFLNGHIPLSATLAFIGLIVAHIHNYSELIVSNEFSSNEANVSYHHQGINHQYSKSIVFETDFRNYISEHLHSNINFFSFLRPLYELQIAKLFTNFPLYWKDFVSCNQGQSTNQWCGQCPKCVFVFTCLYPFMDLSTLIKIFKSNLFQNESLLPIFISLIDGQQDKPFECVGTREETLVALYLSVKKTKTPLPPVLHNIQESYLVHQKNLQQRSHDLLTHWNDHHFLPTKYQNWLKEALAHA